MSAGARGEEHCGHCVVAGAIGESALPGKPGGHCRKADARMCVFMTGSPGEMGVTPSCGEWWCLGENFMEVLVWGEKGRRHARIGGTTT